MRYLFALIVLSFLSADAFAGHCRAPVRRLVAAVVPGRVVERESHRKVTRTPLFPRRAVAAPACMGPSCPVPAVAPKPKGK